MTSRFVLLSTLTVALLTGTAHAQISGGAPAPGHSPKGPMGPRPATEPAPEPATMGLIALGAGGLAYGARRRKKALAAKAAGWGGHVVVIPDAAFPEEQRSQSAQDLAVSTQRIRAELGYSEAVPLSEALAQTVEWERTNMPDPDPAQFDYELEDKLLASQSA